MQELQASAEILVKVLSQATFGPFSVSVQECLENAKAHPPRVNSDQIRARIHPIAMLAAEALRGANVAIFEVSCH